MKNYYKWIMCCLCVPMMVLGCSPAAESGREPESGSQLGISKDGPHPLRISVEGDQENADPEASAYNQEVIAELSLFINDSTPQNHVYRKIIEDASQALYASREFLQLAEWVKEGANLNPILKISGELRDAVSAEHASLILETEMIRRKVQPEIETINGALSQPGEPYLNYVLSDDRYDWLVGGLVVHISDIEPVTGTVRGETADGRAVQIEAGDPLFMPLFQSIDRGFTPDTLVYYSNDTKLSDNLLVYADSRLITYARYAYRAAEQREQHSLD